MACLVAMQCAACGREQYRRRQFIPVVPPLYKNHEEPLPEWCCDLPVSQYHTAVCRGQLELIPGGMIDLLPSNFEIDMEMFGDGSDKRKVRVHSLSELRSIEKESLRRAANGEGVPLVWRDLSQDHSNRDVHALRGTTYERGRAMPRPAGGSHTQSGLPITGSALDSQPD